MKCKFNEVCVDVYGDLAIYTNPHTKNSSTFESYKIPTASVLVNVLGAYYAHPHFRWVIDKVRVMENFDNTFTQSNVFHAYQGGKLETRTYLKNVHYKVLAHCELVECDEKYTERYDMKNPRNVIGAIIAQFKRRVQRNTPYKNPYLGQAECECYIKMCDDDINEPDGYYKDSEDIKFDHIFIGFRNYGDFKAWTCKKKRCFADLCMVGGLVEYPNLLKDDKKMSISEIGG